jgi:hypothetical protein
MRPSQITCIINGRSGEIFEPRVCPKRTTPRERSMIARRRCVSNWALKSPAGMSLHSPCQDSCNELGHRCIQFGAAEVESASFREIVRRPGGRLNARAVLTTSDRQTTAKECCHVHHGEVRVCTWASSV